MKKKERKKWTKKEVQRERPLRRGGKRMNEGL
jgi:hypothetical protein